MHGSMDHVILQLIETTKQGLTGELVDRGRVIDQLLDLRSAAADEPGLILFIDDVLRSVPGQTVVEASWWLTALEQLAEAATPEPAV